MLEQKRPDLTEIQLAVLHDTEQFVKDTLAADSTGHDWWHICRVLKNARKIAEREQRQCDLFVVELGALLHDIADWKFHDGDGKAGGIKARHWLASKSVEPETINHVCMIIDTVSYKGAAVENKMSTLEGEIVQDADRLDALGAIGIARTFAYGGHAGRSMYEPHIKPTLHASFEDYKKSKSHTINHFYEKLLLLKDRLNTQSARSLAQARHDYMQKFLEQFYLEWNAED